MRKFKHYFIICQNINLDFKKYQHCIFIGVDSGSLALINNNLKITLACGDFDSVSNEERVRIIAAAKETVILDSEKDILDSEYAIQKAITLKANKITLAVTGPRWDMTFALIFLLKKYKKYNLEIINDTNHLIFIEKTITIKQQDFKQYHYVSFLPLVKSEINLKGFKYQLTVQKILEPYDNYWISNCFNQKEAIIEIKSGYGILIFSQ